MSLAGGSIDSDSARSFLGSVRPACPMLDPIPKRPRDEDHLTMQTPLRPTGSLCATSGSARCAPTPRAVGKTVAGHVRVSAIRGRPHTWSPTARPSDARHCLGGQRCRHAASDGTVEVVHGAVTECNALAAMARRRLQPEPFATQRFRRAGCELPVVTITDAKHGSDGVGGLIASIASCLASAPRGNAKRSPAGMTMRSRQTQLERGGTTRSPTPTLVTPGPTASTRPTPSFPITDGSSRGTFDETSILGRGTNPA
jgi:hypothetical protein